MSPNEEKRRKSIAYILRRRKRGRKVRANSNEDIAVLTPRGRGQIVFKPSGYAAERWRFLNVLVGLTIVACSFLVFALPSLPPLTWHGGPMDQAIFWVLIGLLGMVTVFAMVFIALSLFRIVRSNLIHKNE